MCVCPRGTQIAFVAANAAGTSTDRSSMCGTHITAWFRTLEKTWREVEKGLQQWIQRLLIHRHPGSIDFITQEKLFYSEISKLFLYENYTNKTSPPKCVLLLCKSGHAYSQLPQKTREFLSILLYFYIVCNGY